MKRLLTILLVCVLAASLCACGGSSSGGAAKKSKTLSGEVTMKSAVDDSPRIWFTAQKTEGRNTVIDGVYYFNNGKVTAYSLRLLGWDKSEKLGRLEDYYDLSDEEALDLARTRYIERYESYYDLDKAEEWFFNEYGDHLDEVYDVDAQLEAFEAAKKELAAYEIPEKEPVDYSYSMLIDDTGNRPSAEAISTTVDIEMTCRGQLGLQDYSSRLYETFSPEKREILLPAEKEIAPFEVFDAYYGGYVGSIREKRMAHRTETYTACMFTKCDKDATFVLDPKDTEGIEILN